MTLRKFGLFYYTLSPIVTFLIAKALVLLSQNPWHPLPLKPWRHLWSTPLTFILYYNLSESFKDLDKLILNGDFNWRLNRFLLITQSHKKVYL